MISKQRLCFKIPVKLYTIKISLKSIIKIAPLLRLLVGYLQREYKLFSWLRKARIFQAR